MWFLGAIWYIFLIGIFILWGLYSLIKWINQGLHSLEIERQQKLEQEKERELRSKTYCNQPGCNHTQLSNSLRTCEFCSLLFCEDHSISKEYRFLGRHSFCYPHQNNFFRFDNRENDFINKEKLEKENKRKKELDQELEIKRKRIHFENLKAINPNIDCCSHPYCYETEDLRTCSGTGCSKMICPHHTYYGLCNDCRIDEIND